jgi:insertion element IS1 protein InsB
VSYINQKLIDRLPDEEERIARNKLEVEVCISAECDEQWSFVQNKRKQRWLWYVLEKTTRKVVAFTFGRRTNATFQKLTKLLPERLIDRLDTDD